MKRASLLFIISLPLFAFAQGFNYTFQGKTGNYVLQGKIGNYNAPAKAYIQFWFNGERTTDSVTLHDGKFQFTGEVGSVPISAYLIVNPKGTGPDGDDYRLVYLEQGTASVTGDGPLTAAKASGTKTNDDNERYNIALKQINAEYDSLDARIKAATDDQQQSPAFQKENNEAKKILDARYIQLNKKFIQDNPDSYISLTALQNCMYQVKDYALRSDYTDYETLFNGLSSSVRTSEGARKFAENLPRLKSVALGAVAPDFAEADTSGNMVNISSFRGKYVLIDFWASWCVPCRRENPNIVRAFNHYKTQNFTIVGVSLDPSWGKQAWLNAIHHDHLTWTHISDLKLWDTKVADLYALSGIPQNFLLDPNGKIIAKNLMGMGLEDKLEEIFGKI